MNRRFTKVAQLACLAVIKCAALPFAYRRSGFLPNIRTWKGKEGILIAANHRSRLDGFFIMASLTWRECAHLAPLCFMTANQYVPRGIRRTMASWIGLFPAYREEGVVAGLDLAKSYLQQGFSLMIFPEGQRALPGEVRPKKGLAVLATELKRPVLPVHIEYEDTPGILRRKTRIRFEGPLCLRKLADLQKVIDHLLVVITN